MTLPNKAALDAQAMTYGKEKCGCGDPICKTWWLTGIGSFRQGSGFTEAEADEIIAALRAEPPADVA